MESEKIKIQIRFNAYRYGWVEADTLDELIEILYRKRVTRFDLGYTYLYDDTEYISVSDLTPKTLSQKEIDWLIKDNIHHYIVNRNFPMDESDIIR